MRLRLTPRQPTTPRGGAWPLPHLDVSLIAQWSQKHAQAANWDAPTINAAAAAILRANPQASRAMLVLSDAGRPFLLLQFGDTWSDAEGARIAITILKDEDQRPTPPTAAAGPRAAPPQEKASSRTNAAARASGSHRSEKRPGGEGVLSQPQLYSPPGEDVGELESQAPTCDDATVRQQWHTPTTARE